MKKPVELASDLSPWRKRACSDLSLAWHRDPGLVKPTPIILIGLRAAGKTTLGRELAEGLEVAFQDLDDLALTQSGAHRLLRSLPSLGNQLGDARARSVRPWLASPSAVLACGGGALHPRVRASMQGSGACVVYLHAGVDALVARGNAKIRSSGSLGLVDSVKRWSEPTPSVIRSSAIWHDTLSKSMSTTNDS